MELEEDILERILKTRTLSFIKSHLSPHYGLIRNMDFEKGEGEKMEKTERLEIQQMKCLRSLAEFSRRGTGNGIIRRQLERHKSSWKITNGTDSSEEVAYREWTTKDFLR
jgi:hypothetical protein